MLFYAPLPFPFYNLSRSAETPTELCVFRGASQVPGLQDQTSSLPWQLLQKRWERLKGKSELTSWLPSNSWSPGNHHPSSQRWGPEGELSLIDILLKAFWSPGALSRSSSGGKSTFLLFFSQRHKCSLCLQAQWLAGGSGPSRTLQSEA